MYNGFLMNFLLESSKQLMKTPQSRMLCGVCAVKTANSGPSSAARTHGLLVPNLSGKLFPLVYSGFRRFLICFTYSLTLLFPLFPGTPAPSVVIYVVKNASRPVSGEDSPVPDGKRFAFLCGVYCNSAEGVMQVVSAWVAAQQLRRYRQRRVSLQHENNRRLFSIN